MQSNENQNENSPFNFVRRHIGRAILELVFRAIVASKSRSCRFQIYQSIDWRQGARHYER